jgi:hypothetical protein
MMQRASHRQIAWTRARYTRYSRLGSVERRLRSLIIAVDRRIEELELVGAPRYTVYNYMVLRRILEDVYAHVSSGRRVNSRTTYILPGAIWVAKSLVEGRLSIGEAATYIDRTRYLARKMFRTLVYEKNLTLVIPSNLSPKEIKVFLWADKVGYDREGNPLYMLTMYFSFPFDINELDKRSEYEPVSFLFVKKNGRYIPLKAYARIHYDLYVYDISELENVEILFMRLGHTPKILSSEVGRISSGNMLKELLDKAWIVIGDFITRLTGTYKLRIRDSPEDIHVYVNYKLPPTINNPFKAPIHPYFSDITFP